MAEITEKLLGKNSKSTEDSMKKLSVYAVGGIIGLASANWVASKINANQYYAWISLVGGIVALIAAAKIGAGHKSVLVAGARVLVGFAAVVLILRGAASVVGQSAKLTSVSMNIL